MKKLTLVFLALILCLSGCANKKNDDIKAPDKPEEVLDPAKMCNLLWERSDTGTDSVILKDDLDSDGIEEEIVVRVNDGALEISSDRYSYSSGNAYISTLSKVYALDMDPGDGITELAVLTVEDSDDSCLRVLKVTDGNMGALGFKSDGGNIAECFFTGYDQALYVNDKNILTLSERGRVGMWSLEVSFKLNDGIFEKIDESERKVVYPSYGEIANLLSAKQMMESGYVLNEEEYLLLKEKGMAVAHADFDPAAGEEMMPLKINDVFSVVSETDDGKVKIKKENGEEGYIDLSDWHNNRLSVSLVMFFLAD